MAVSAVREMIDVVFAQHGRDGHWYLHTFNQPLVSHSMAVALLS
jgi:hypothetical protein